jgi:hypothetical protein
MIVLSHYSAELQSKEPDGLILCDAQLEDRSTKRADRLWNNSNPLRPSHVKWARFFDYARN